MESELQNDKALCEHLGLITSEILKIREELQKIASREADLKNLFAEAANIKESLEERVTGLESLIKKAAALALTEVNASQELKAHFEAETVALQTQLAEQEDILHTRDAAFEELKKTLEDKNNDLQLKITEKAKLLELRETVLEDLKSTTGALNTLTEDLESFKEERIISLQASQQQVENFEASKLKDKEMKELEARMAAEIRGLKNKIQEKNVVLRARELEIKMVKQTMGARIDELQTLTNPEAPRKRRSPRLVSFFTAGGKKN